MPPFYKKIYQVNNVWQALGQYKKKFSVLFIMVTISSFLDALSITLIIPVLELLVVDDKNYSFILSLFVSVFGDIDRKLLLSIVLVFILLALIIKSIFVIIKNKLHLNLLYGLRKYWMTETAKKYVTSDYPTFNQYKSGTLISNLTVETEKAQFCINFVIKTLSSVTIAVFMLVVLLISSWKATLSLMPIAILALFIIYRFANKFSRDIGRKKIRYSKDLLNYSTDIIHSLEKIKIFQQESNILNYNQNIVNKYTKTFSDFRFYSLIPKSIGEVLSFIILMIIINYIIFYTLLPLNKLVPTISVFVIVLNRLIPQITSISSGAMNILANIESLFLVDKLVRKPIKQESQSNGGEYIEFKNKIVFKNCSFSQQNRKIILDKINMELPKGNLVALYGIESQINEVLTNLIFRLYQPDSGEILMDGININYFTIKAWRNKIKYINNYTPLFNLSIKDNIIGINHHLTEEDIKKVSNQFNLLDFVPKLPNGYDTLVNQKGFNLSDSQIMEIKFIRTLINDPALIIFEDDINYSLKNTINTLKNIFKGKTILLLTKNKSLIKDVNISFELIEGKIIEHK